MIVNIKNNLRHFIYIILYKNANNQMQSINNENEFCDLMFIYNDITGKLWDCLYIGKSGQFAQ